MQLSDTINNTLSVLSQHFPIPSMGNGTEIDFSRRYAEYLLLQHGIVRASVPLMQFALDRCNDQGDASLASFLQEHIREELNHDVWLEEDFYTFNEKTFDKYSVPASIARLVGSQYYLIAHVDKVALLGYILVLEDNPPSARSIASAIHNSRLPNMAFRTVLHHAEVDTTHVKELKELIDVLALSKRQTELIRNNAIQTAIQMRLILDI